MHDALVGRAAEAVLARPAATPRRGSARRRPARPRARACGTPRTSATNSVLPLTRLSPSSLSSQPVSASTRDRGQRAASAPVLHSWRGILLAGGAARAGRPGRAARALTGAGARRAAPRRRRSPCARRRPTSSARAPPRRSPRACARAAPPAPRASDARPSASWVTASGPTSKVSHGRTSGGDRRGQRARDLRHPGVARRRPAARRRRRPRRRPCRTPRGTCSASRAPRRRAARRRAPRARAARPSARAAAMPSRGGAVGGRLGAERVEERGQLGQLAPVLAAQRPRGVEVAARERAGELLELLAEARRSRRRAAARPGTRASTSGQAASSSSTPLERDQLADEQHDPVAPRDRARRAPRRPRPRSARTRSRGGRARRPARSRPRAPSAARRVRERGAQPLEARGGLVRLARREAGRRRRRAGRAASSPPGPGSSSAAHRLSAVWREPTSTPRAPAIPSRADGQEARVRLDRVLQRAAVDLHRVRAPRCPRARGRGSAGP